MKKQFLLRGLILILSLSISNLYSYTAISSGDWSSASTWGGSVPGASISLADVVIPSGIDVNLDENVVFKGLLNKLVVNGKLSSTSKNSLKIEEGTLAGSGIISINRLIFSSASAGSTFTGKMSLKNFFNDGSSLSLGATIDVEDTMSLKGGALVLGPGAVLTMKNNSFIVMNHGNLSAAGGVFNSASNYNYSIRYEGGTQETGIELQTNKLQGLYLWLDNPVNTLTLTSNLLVNSDIHLRTGKFIIKGKNLILNRDIWRGEGATFVSDQYTNVTVQGFMSATDGLAFEPGSAVNNLIVDMHHNTRARLRSNLDIYGQFKLMSGYMAIEDGAEVTLKDNGSIYVDDGKILLRGGTLNTEGAYNLEYFGAADTTGCELECANLKNVKVNLKYGTSTLYIARDLAISGQLQMEKGHLVLGNYPLKLNGGIRQSPEAGIICDANSVLEINLTSPDTIYFSENNNILNKMKISMQGTQPAVLGSDLHISGQLQLGKGMLDLGNSRLYMDPQAQITGYNGNSYIVTSGKGRLVMEVDKAGPYVLFPVGTVSGYSPASVQQTANGSSGQVMIGVIDGVYANGLATGYNYAVFGSLVNRTWLIEPAEEGNDVHMNLKLAWNIQAEKNGFNRQKAYITHYVDSRWDSYATSAAKEGPYSTYEIERRSITSASAFAVSDNSSRLSNEDITDNNGISVFPNPASDEVRINVLKTSGEYVFELTDFTGKVLQSSDSRGPVDSFHVGHLAKGCYFIRVTDPATRETMVSQFVKY